MSVDGDGDGNRYRVDYSERPAFEQVERTLSLLEAEVWPIGVICVVHQGILERAFETLAYFTRFRCIKSVALVPCFDYKVLISRSFKEKRALRLIDERVEEPAWSTTPNEYMRFLRRAFSLWRDEGWFESFTIEPFFSTIRSVSGKAPTLCHFAENKCGHALTLYPDGTIGTCDELRGEESELGNVANASSLAEVLEWTSNPLLRSGLDRLLEKCDACEYQSTCGGGCLATRRQYEGTVFDDEYCRYRKDLVDMVRAAVEQPAPSCETEA